MYLISLRAPGQYPEVRILSETIPTRYELIAKIKGSNNTITEHCFQCFVLESPDVCKWINGESQDNDAVIEEHSANLFAFRSRNTTGSDQTMVIVDVDKIEVL